MFVAETVAYNLQTRTLLGFGWKVLIFERGRDFERFIIVCAELEENILTALVNYISVSDFNK